MELYSPSFFADFVSKPSASFSVSDLCSEAMLRARERSAGGTVSATAKHQLQKEEGTAQLILLDW